MSTPHRSALIVEDNPEFELLLAEAVASLGPDWRAQCARNGTDALAAIEGKGQRTELVLVDLGLPDMSGVAVIHAARRRFPNAPIMVVSVLSNSENVLAAIRAGAQGYVHKGDSALTIAQAIRRVLAGEYPISAALAHYLFSYVQRQAPAPPEDNAVRLSVRELELLRLLSQGYQYDEAAARMSVTHGTVQSFVKRIYQKLHVNSKVRAISTARELGWI